jgi:putative peptidoglycan lipid II flippase
MRGAFTYADVLGSAYALQMYGLSLWAVGYTRIQTQALYAMQKARVVVNISWISLVVNIVFCLVLMPFMKHAGIALASSLAVLVQLFVQHRYVVRSGVHLPKEHRIQISKMVAASLVMGAVLVPFARMDAWKTGLTVQSGCILAACVVFGGGMYFAILWVMGMREFFAGRTTR